MSEELQSAPESQDWSSYLSEQLSEVADDQLETESETEEVSEDIEVTDDSEVVESDETTEEVEEAPLFNDDTEIDLGEGRNPVKLAELKNGYLRQSDYTKKTQALSDERKTFESERAELEPVKGWLEYINTNPYLFQQINNAIQEWNQTGVLPLEEVINTESGPYINHLMSENSRLQKELDRISGEYQTTKFDGDMKALVNDLKAEYGDLIDSEYEQSLITQAKEQGLSIDVLKRIAKGDLAEKKLQQTQQESKKVEAKTKQKIRETKLPPQPKKVGNQPAKEELDTSGDWLSLFKQASGK
jgi:hypothetical protein